MSVCSDPSTQRGLPFALLLTLIGRKAQLTFSFYTEVSSRNDSFNTAREATQIQQADSTQWLLLDHGTKDSGLSFSHPLRYYCPFAIELIIPGGQGLEVLYSHAFKWRLVHWLLFLPRNVIRVIWSYKPKDKYGI